MGVIQRQGIKNALTTYAGIFIGFINLIIIQPHFLTKEELGLTRILYSFSLLVAMFVPMGISNATTKFFPQFKNEKTRHHGFFGFILLFPLLGFLLACALLWFLKDFILNQYRRESPLFLDYFHYVYPLIFFLSFITLLNLYCNAHFKSTIPAFLNDVVVRIITIALVSIYFLRWITLPQFITLYVGIYALQLIGLLIYIFIFDKVSFKIDWGYFREKKIFDMIGYGMLLWFAGVASIGLKYFDSIMVGKFMPLGFVAIYTIAAFIPTIIEAPLNALEKIAAAKISFAWAENKRDEIKNIYHKSSLYMILVGGFLFLNVNINIVNLLSFLPKDYWQGNTVVLIISIGTMFNMATGLNAPVLFNSEKYRYGAVFLISLAVLSLATQMYFIPRLGLEGAALATALSALIYNSMMTIAVWKFFKLQPFDKRNLQVLLLIAVCFALNFLIPSMENRIIDVFLRTSIVSLLYLLAVYVLKIVPEFHRYLPWERK